MGSRAVAGALPLSAPSISMLPFLYQTCTLSSIHLVRTGSIRRLLYKPSTGLRGISNSTRHGSSSNEPQILITSSKLESGSKVNGPIIRRTITRHGLEETPSNTEGFTVRRLISSKDYIAPKDNARSDETPLLAKTEYQDSQSSRPRIPKSKKIPSYTEFKSKGPKYDIPWTHELDESSLNTKDALGTEHNLGIEGADDIDEPDLEAHEWGEGIPEDFAMEDEIANLTAPQGTRESTITTSERHAFQKIFSDIFARSQSVHSGDREQIPNEPYPEVATNRQVAKLKLDNIINTAMKRQPRTREEKQTSVNQYPPALKAAAAKAIGLESDGPQETNEETMSSESLEALREPERARIEALMKASRTDFELWEVLEKEVFPLISKLGLEDNASDSEVLPTIPKKKGKKSKKAKPEHESTARDVLETSFSVNGIPALALYGPLYPSHLLLALRLLDRSFSAPSPLALALLPAIKSLGLISHVLGATTQFYNELMRIYRYRYDDYRGILRLLTEMEDSALEMDGETLEFVVDVMRTQGAVRRGEKGEALKALWGMPEFGTGKFKVWRDRIERGISERAESQSAGLTSYRGI